MNDDVQARVAAEVDAELLRQRRSGALTGAFEHALASEFHDVGPERDLDRLIERAEELAVVDGDAPATSPRRAVSSAKRLVQRSTGWALRYLADQATASLGAIVDVLGALAERLDALEAVAPPPDTAAGEAARRARRDTAAVHDDAVRAVAGAAGRVLVADAGDGALLRAIRGAGTDAYGTEPDGAQADALARDGLDVRAVACGPHLASCDDGALRAIVLEGCVDRLPLRARFAVLDGAARVLAPGGAIVVVSSSPARWGVGSSVVEADLSPGRPLHAETWAHLLGTRGFVGCETQPSPVTNDAPAFVVRATRPVHPAP